MRERPIRNGRIALAAGFVSAVWGIYALGVDLDWLENWPSIACVLTIHCVVSTMAAIGLIMHEVHAP